MEIDLCTLLVTSSVCADCRIPIIANVRRMGACLCLFVCAEYIDR